MQMGKKAKYLGLMAEQMQYMTQIVEFWIAHVSLSISIFCKLDDKYPSRSFMTNIHPEAFWQKAIN